MMRVRLSVFHHCALSDMRQRRDSMWGRPGMLCARFDLQYSCSRELLLYHTTMCVPAITRQALRHRRIASHHMLLQSVAAIQARQAARGMRRLAQRRMASLSHAEFDVVVCGGGVVGTSVAYHLARASPSLRVAVVERDPSGEHASAPRSAGGIRQQFSLQPNIELSLYGVDFLRRAANDLHVPGEQPPDVQFKENGYLFLASEQGVATLRSNHATQARAGASTVLLEPAELAARL